MKKLNQLLAVVFISLYITFSSTFPFIEISTSDLNTSVVTVDTDRQMKEEAVMTLQSHFPSRRVNTLQ